MIYCGYQGVGKTSYCRTHPDCVDLDSSAYTKEPGWEKKYIKDAITFEKKGKRVFISAHREVIQQLLKINHSFTLIIPGDNEKIWRLRLNLRYEITREDYALAAITDFNENFAKDMKFYKSLQCKKIIVNATRVLTNLTEQFEREGS